MNFDKIKELLKNKKVQAISALAVCGVIAIGSAIFLMKDTTKVEKSVAVENKSEANEDNKDTTEEEAKKQLEELKQIDISNLSEEEKKRTEEQIKAIEDMIDKKEYVQVKSEVESVKNSIASKVENTENKEVKKEETTTKVEEKKTETKQEEVATTKTTESVKVEAPVTKAEEKKETPVHTHTWVDVTETVTHAEEGHYEEVVVTPKQVKEVPVYETQSRDICNGCGTDISDSPWKHVEEQALKGIYTCNGHHGETRQVQTGTKQEVIPAVTEKKWVVDKAAWTETKVVGKRCSSCGVTN